MAIVSSRYVLGVPQADGRRYVEELHTDEAGNVYRVEYGPVGDVDYQAIMEARAISIGQIAADEAAVPYLRAEAE